MRMVSLTDISFFFRSGNKIVLKLHQSGKLLCNMILFSLLSLCTSPYNRNICCPPTPPPPLPSLLHVSVIFLTDIFVNTCAHWFCCHLFNSLIETQKSQDVPVLWLFLQNIFYILYLIIWRTFHISADKSFCILIYFRLCFVK